jgi:PAS domain-containing protein
MNNISSAIERGLNESIIYRSEERFRLLADNIPGTIYLSKYDSKFTKIYLNNEIEKLSGYPKEIFLNNEISFENFESDVSKNIDQYQIPLVSKKWVSLLS